MTTHRSLRTRSLAGVAVAATAVVAVACVPQPAPTDPGTGGETTTTATPTTATPTTATPTTAPSNTVAIANAKLDFRLNAESDQISHSGQPNYWSAGISDGTAATYTASNGNATVYKKVNGVDIPVGTSTATYANLRVSEDGTNATQANKKRFGYHVVFTGGTGSRNTSTGAATVQWTGTFSVSYYGGLVPFWIKDPKLTVAPNGSATLTAQAQGTIGDEDTQQSTGQVTPWTNVTLAEFTVTAGQTSFTASPAYVGKLAPTGVSAPQSDPQFTNPAYYGSYPASWVNFQELIGLGAMWYSSGGTADRYKLPDTFSVNYNG